MWTTAYYPCKWDDLIDEQRRTHATFYTLKNAKEDGFEAPGITLGEDGVYDIVVDAPELSHVLVRRALTGLSKITGLQYQLQVGDE